MTASVALLPAAAAADAEYDGTAESALVACAGAGKIYLNWPTVLSYAKKSRHGKAS